MGDDKKISDIEKLSVSITDLDFYEGLQEIIDNLESVYKNYDLHCMNDGIIGLQGEKKMLGAVIYYLKRVKGADIDEWI